MHQVLLPSGRGLRFTPLSPSESDGLYKDSVKLIGEDGTVAELQVAVRLAGIKQMIRAVTEKDGLTDADLLKPETKWRTVSVQDLDDNYDKYFSTKAHMALGVLYRNFHEIGQDAVDAMLGKVVEVAND